MTQVNKTEITAATVRYARSGHFTTAQQILVVLTGDFPDNTEKEIKQAMVEAAEKLLAQHEPRDLVRHRSAK